MRRDLLRSLIGIAISIVALAIVVRGVDLDATASVLREADLAWVGAMVLCACCDLACRAVRWRELLLPIRAVAVTRTLAYYLVGNLANNVLPARLGELVRSHYLGDREGISRTTALGTIVVERVVDATVLVGLAAVSILALGVRGIVASAVLVGVGLVALLVIGLALALVAHRLPFADRAIAAVERWPFVVRLAGRLRNGLAVVQRPRTLALAVAWSLAAWGATVASVAAAGNAVGIELSWGQAALLGAGTSLVTAIPAGPASLGTFEVAAVTIAGVFGIPPAQGLALAILMHVVYLAVTSLGGVVALARIGWVRPTAGSPA